LEFLEFSLFRLATESKGRFDQPVDQNIIFIYLDDPRVWNVKVAYGAGPFKTPNMDSSPMRIADLPNVSFFSYLPRQVLALLTGTYPGGMLSENSSGYQLHYDSYYSTDFTKILKEQGYIRVNWKGTWGFRSGK